MLKAGLSFFAGILLASSLYAEQSSHYTLLQLLGNSNAQFTVCNKIGNINQKNCTVTGTGQGIYSSPIMTGEGAEYFYSVYWPQTMPAPKFDISCVGVTVNPSAYGAYYIGNGKNMGYVYNYNPVSNLMTCQTIPQAN